MALVIYSNGIVEELIPANKIFTDKELTDTFEYYENIKSLRLSEIPNTWCIWGEMNNPKDYEYNKLASAIANEEVFSHIIFIHDTELDREWKVTDNIIYKPYVEFIDLTSKFITNLMQNINEDEKEDNLEAENTSMIFLTILGHTKDKRVLFAFNPDEQNDTFYIDGGWENFSSKIYEYLVKNFDNEMEDSKKPFVIFSDTKTIVIIEDHFVNNIIDKLIFQFQQKEQYEKCSVISNIKDKWYKIKNQINSTIDSSIGVEKKKKIRKKKKTDD